MTPPTARSRRHLPTALRLAAVQWGVVFLSAVLVFGTINRATERLLEAEAQELVATELRGLTEIHALGGSAALRAAIERRLAERPGGAHVSLLLAADGAVSAGNLAAWPEGVESAETGEARITVHRTDLGRPTTIAARAIALPGGARLLIGRDAAIEARTRDELGLALLLGIGAATLVAGAVGWLLSRHLLARMMGIRQTATAIMDGDLSRRIPVEPIGDEFDLLAETLNRMLARLETQLGALAFASTGIAHDLRAPLTRLRLRLETLEAADGHGAVAPALAEVARIERILSALLSIARARSGAGRAQMSELDLAEIAADVADLYEPMASERGVALAFDAPVPVRARCHGDLVFLALSNLAENAIHAVPPGGRVTIAASAADGAATLALVDDGPGLPDAVRAALEEGRSGHDPAARPGLGLPLVRAVAAMHDGTLRLTDRRPGLEARLSIPR